MHEFLQQLSKLVSLEYLLALILVVVAASCNAVMDVIAHKWYQSIFTSFKGKWYKWFHQTSWKNKYIDWDGGDKRRKYWVIRGYYFNVPVQFTDAWHFCKSLMIINLILLATLPGAGIVASISAGMWAGLLADLVAFFILGLTWNVTFLTLYKRVLLKSYK